MIKLLSLKVTNFCSFYDEQTLNLNNKGNSNIAAIYGPNASGKSNTAKALSFVKKFILTSADAKNINIPYEPFQLIQDNKEPTNFELEFIYNNHKIRYSFSFTDSKISSEKLTDLSGQKPKVIFNRKDQEITNLSTAKGFGFTSHLLSQTRDTTLLITKARENNNSYANIVFGFISHLNIVTCGTPILRQISIDILQSNPDIKKKVLNFLKFIDFSIQDIVEYNYLSPEEIFTSFANPNSTQQTDNKILPHDLGAIHSVRDKDGNVTGTSLLSLTKQESKGTNVIFDLATLIIDSIEHNSILYIDEFGLHLHTDVCKFIIFQYRKHQDVQLIFNTHNILLMDILKREEMVFIGKRQNESSIIVPFTDLSPRKDEVYSKRYTEGLYGFKPFISMEAIG